MQEYPSDNTTQFSSNPLIAPPPPDPRTPIPSSQKPSWIPWIAAILIVFFIGYGAGASSFPLLLSSFSKVNSNTAISQKPTATPSPKPSPTPTLTLTPTKVLKWTVTHTFTGKETQSTDYFELDKDWKLRWSCDPATIPGAYNAIVSLYDENAQLLEGLLNTYCQPGNTGGEQLIHQQAKQTIYLKIEIAGEWKVEVLELR